MTLTKPAKIVGRLTLMVLSLVAAACSGGTSTPTLAASASSAPGTPPIATQGQIAFASERDGDREIYVMDADGRDLRRLTNDPAKDGPPAWSPDGTKIAFVSVRDGKPDIYLINADGTGVRRLADAPDDDLAPAWSHASEVP